MEGGWRCVVGGWWSSKCVRGDSNLNETPNAERRFALAVGVVLSFVVRRSSFVVRRSSFVVRRSSFVVRRSSSSLSFVVVVERLLSLRFNVLSTCRAEGCLQNLPCCRNRPLCRCRVVVTSLLRFHRRIVVV